MSETPRFSYEFHEKNAASKEAVSIIRKYLLSLADTKDVVDVQDSAQHQGVDVDLLWHRDVNGEAVEVKIEVKADTYRPINFWLETLSNKAKGTLGCFLLTEANYVYYYFTSTDTLFIIPMTKAKPWFQNNLHRFENSETSSKDKQGKYTHTTVGRKVPIDTMCKEIPTIECIQSFSAQLAARP